MKQGLWWLLRALVYYTIFEGLAPFAVFFGGRWGRVFEGVAFAIAAATVHPILRKRFANRNAKPS